MEQYLEFAGNHPFLLAAFVAVVVMMIAGEIRRKTKGFAVITPQQAILLFNHEDALIVDLRDSEDFNKGHLIEAQNVPYAKLADQIDTFLDKKANPVILYCRTGSQSSMASNQFVAKGFEKVFYIKNGFYGWTGENLPVAK